MSSLDPGFDTANTVQGAISTGAIGEHGTPGFWLRYFFPCPNESLSQDPLTELRAMWDNGTRALGVITAPANIDNGYDGGHNDATTFCDALVSTWNSVNSVSPGSLVLGGSGDLYCWLDQESGVPLGPNYWNGWADKVNSKEFPPGSGRAQLFACLYTVPNQGDNVCVNNGTNGCTSIAGGSTCWGIWSAQPEDCCCTHLSSPPAWDACFCSGRETKIWQWATQRKCSYSSNVDLDVGNSGFNTAAYCLNLAYRP